LNRVQNLELRQTQYVMLILRKLLKELINK